MPRRWFATVGSVALGVLAVVAPRRRASRVFAPGRRILAVLSARIPIGPIVAFAILATGRRFAAAAVTRRWRSMPVAIGVALIARRWRTPAVTVARRLPTLLVVVARVATAARVISRRRRAAPVIARRWPAARRVLAWRRWAIVASGRRRFALGGWWAWTIVAILPVTRGRRWRVMAVVVATCSSARAPPRFFTRAPICFSALAPAVVVSPRRRWAVAFAVPVSLATLPRRPCGSAFGRHRGGRTEHQGEDEQTFQMSGG